MALVKGQKKDNGSLQGEKILKYINSFIYVA